MKIVDSFKGRGGDRKTSNSRSGSFKIKYENISRSCSFKAKNELLCTCPPSGDVAEGNGDSGGTPSATKQSETICVTLTYKPRI